MSNRSTIRFFAVGCWNRGLVPEQSLVFDSIIHNQSKMEGLLILGDNIYPNSDVFSEKYLEEHKEINPKQHDLSVYRKGLHGLLTSTDGIDLLKPVYFVLGNHDVTIKQRNCEIYKTQLSLNEHYPALHTKFPYSSEIFISKDFSVSVKLIFIDTNFFDLGIDYSISSCISSNSDNLIKLNKQLEWLDEELDKTRTDYVVVIGHHPIVFNKMKNGSPKEGFNDTLLHLFGKYTKRNITYLCADNHMYQDWNIRYPDGRSINQIICGTGGAILDTGGNEKEYFIRDGIRFFRDKEISKTNGFCQLIFNKDCKSVRFYDVYKHSNPSSKSSIKTNS